EDQPVVRVIPRHVALAALRGGLAIEDHGAEADPAELLAHVVGAPRLAPALLLREVDAQELARVGGGARGRRGLRCASGDGCRSHTATGVPAGAFDGRPSTVWGSSTLVVFDAMNTGLTSKGFRRR